MCCSLRGMSVGGWQWWNWNAKLGSGGTISGRVTYEWEALQPKEGNSVTIGYIPTAAKPGSASFVPTSITVQGNDCVIEQES